MNKLLSSILILTITLFMVNCKKSKTTTNNNGTNNGTNDPVVVDIDRSDTTSISEIPPLPLSLDLMSNPQILDTFATKVDEYINPYGFTKNDMIKVNLTKLSLTLENAPLQTLNFVKDTTPYSIKVFVDSFNGTMPKMVASKVNVPRDIKSLTFDVVQDDIKDYFRADYMKIMVGFYTQENEGMVAGTKIRANYTFKVTAKKP